MDFKAPLYRKIYFSVLIIPIKAELSFQTVNFLNEQTQHDTNENRLVNLGMDLIGGEGRG